MSRVGSYVSAIGRHHDKNWPCVEAVLVARAQCPEPQIAPKHGNPLTASLEPALAPSVQDWQCEPKQHACQQYQIIGRWEHDVHSHSPADALVEAGKWPRTHDIFRHGAEVSGIARCDHHGDRRAADNVGAIPIGYPNLPLSVTYKMSGIVL
jgi:hypothetical protein